MLDQGIGLLKMNNKVNYFIPIWHEIINKVYACNSELFFVFMKIVFMIHIHQNKKTLIFKSKKELSLKCLSSFRNITSILNELVLKGLINLESRLNNLVISLPFERLCKTSIQQRKGQKGFLKIPLAIIDFTEAMKKYDKKNKYTYNTFKIYIFLIDSCSRIGFDRDFDFCLKYASSKLCLDRKTIRKSLIFLDKLNIISFKSPKNRKRTEVRTISVKNPDQLNYISILNNIEQSISIPKIEIEKEVIALLTATIGQPQFIQTLNHSPNLNQKQPSNSTCNSWHNFPTQYADFPHKDADFPHKNAQNPHYLENKKKIYKNPKRTEKAIHARKVIFSYLAIRFKNESQDFFESKLQEAIDECKTYGIITGNASTLTPCSHPISYLMTSSPKYGGPAILRVLDRLEQRKRVVSSQRVEENNPVKNQFKELKDAFIKKRFAEKADSPIHEFNQIWDYVQDHSENDLDRLFKLRMALNHNNFLIKLKEKEKFSKTEYDSIWNYLVESRC